MAFQMTPAAAREILAAAARSGSAGLPLRVAARPTRDGLAYGMGFDDQAPDDVVAVVEGLTVLVGAGSSALLAATVLDFVELDTGEQDFVFVAATEAAATPAAGCGTQARGCGGGRCAGCG